MFYDLILENKSQSFLSQKADSHTYRFSSNTSWTWLGSAFAPVVFQNLRNKTRHKSIKKFFKNGNYLQFYYKMYFKSDLVTNTWTVGTHHRILLCLCSPGSRVREEFLPGIQIHGTVHELGTSLPWDGVHQSAHALLEAPKAILTLKHGAQIFRIFLPRISHPLGRTPS